MNSECALVSKVVSFLNENGYPPESILLEYAIPRSNGLSPFRADITIVAPRELRPIAIFEIKAKPFSKQLYETASHQISAYAVRLQGPLRSFLVFTANNEKGFAIYEVTTNELGNNAGDLDNSQYDEPPHIISFDDLIRGDLAEQRNSEIERKGEHYDEFQKWRLIGFILLIVLFFREYQRNGWGLSWECLSVLCGAFVLWLLPYYDVIGFKDIVLQRHQDKMDK